MNDIYIYHHLGLGDHIILNGFVRSYLDQYDRIFLFSKPRNSENIKRMYRDVLSKIKIISLDDKGVHEFMNMFRGYKYLIVGHTPDFFRRVDDPNSSKTFDQIFYEDHQIPFSYKWDRFFLERDIEKEKEIYHHVLGLDDDSKFIFLHESNERPINREIPSNIKIIRPDNMSIGIFDYLYTIQKAKEVHVMNSSFMNLIDCIQLREDNIFYHEYSRPNINTALKLPWKILK